MTFTNIQHFFGSGYMWWIFPWKSSWKSRVSSLDFRTSSRFTKTGDRWWRGSAVSSCSSPEWTGTRKNANMDDAHTKTGEEVVNYFKTDENTGLDDNQIRRHQEKYGPNGMYAFEMIFSPNCRCIFSCNPHMVDFHSFDESVDHRQPRCTLHDDRAL